MTRFTHKFAASALVAPAALAMAIACPAVAQDEQNRSDNRDSEPQYSADEHADDSSQRDRWDDQSHQDRERRRSRDRGGQTQLEPLGWVRVATDYDDDGQFDHVDWIYYHDLQTAQERSRQRGRDGQGRFDRQSRQQVRVRGELQDKRTITMSEGDQAILVTIETDDGQTKRVCLGPKDRLSRLDLQQGDHVTVEGHRARLNDRQIVMANRVMANGESVDVPRRESLRRVSGEIVSKRTTTFRDRDGKFVVAKVRTDEGDTRTIQLGQQQKIEQLDLQEGDRINVLGRNGRVNGQQALIARQIRANDQTIRVGESRTDQRSRR